MHDIADNVTRTIMKSGMCSYTFWPAAEYIFLEFK